MVVSLADRKLFINRMDRQFEENLRMRKNVNFLGSRANGMTKNLHLMQKVRLFITIDGTFRDNPSGDKMAISKKVSAEP